jgi:hypothetical protein
VVTVYIDKDETWNVERFAALYFFQAIHFPANPWLFVADLETKSHNNKITVNTDPPFHSLSVYYRPNACLGVGAELSGNCQ